MFCANIGWASKKPNYCEGASSNCDFACVVCSHTLLTDVYSYRSIFDVHLINIHTTVLSWFWPHFKDQDMENVFLCYKVDSRNCIENKKFQLIQLHLYITTA